MNNVPLPPASELLALYYSGLSVQEIAAQLGATHFRVWTILRKAGFKARTQSEAQTLKASKPGYKPNKYWLGRKQPKEMTERRIASIRGEKHWLWKGGKAKRDYRKVVTKERCALCKGRFNLGIHHKNFDHYDNHPDNLQVLCVSCHSSVHKQSYWDAIHAGITPQRSNGPLGWTRKATNPANIGNLVDTPLAGRKEEKDG